MIAFGIVLAAWIIGEASMTVEDRPAPGTLALPTGLVVLASQAIAVATRGDGAWWGVVVMIAGVALRLSAIAALGRSFATTLDSESLVTTGPYRFARHPSELGLLLILLGGGLLLGSWWAVIAGAAVIPLVAIRCAREDRALARHAGHATWVRDVGWFAPHRLIVHVRARS